MNGNIKLNNVPLKSGVTAQLFAILAENLVDVIVTKHDDKI